MFEKIAIIGGSGNVGSHIAFLGAMRHIAKEILLFSNDIPRCKGVGLDISQAAAIFDIPILIKGCNSYEDIHDLHNPGAYRSVSHNCYIYHSLFLLLTRYAFINISILPSSTAVTLLFSSLVL